MNDLPKLKSLSVFFPAYNEQDNITNTVERAFRAIPNFVEQFEIIAVNDGSSNDTQARLEELSKRYANLKIITHERNKGYGAALRSGLCASQYEYIFYTDGDGQFDVNEIEKLIFLIDSCDIVAALRKMRSDGFHRALNACAYNLFINLFFRLSIRDIDCAFKLVKKKVLDSINLKSDGAFISAEFLIKAKKKGYLIKQCAVSHLPREEGSPTGNNPRVVIRAFKELFKLWKELKQ